MRYKGYTGVVEFDEESAVLFGRVIGLRGAITFQGESVAEVIRAFHDSVDDYLEFCAERGVSPEKPYSGQFILRIDPRLHRDLSHAAEELGISLNSLVEDRLEDALLVGGGAPKGPTGRGRPAKTGAKPSGRTARPADAAGLKAKARKGRGIAKGGKD